MASKKISSNEDRRNEKVGDSDGGDDEGIDEVDDDRLAVGDDAGGDGDCEDGDGGGPRERVGGQVMMMNMMMGTISMMKLKRRYHE